MNELEICRMTALETAGAIKTRKLSPVEVMKSVLSRIERLNPKINAFCTLVPEAALAQAREAENQVMKGDKLGALHGVPVSIKDLIYTKGIRTTAGSKLYENFIPDFDAIAVDRLKKAGAIVFGKTNTPEFGWLGITTNSLFGTTRNPWNLEKTTGGSSGGAVSSIVSCMGSIALGTDVGGSIRIPSSFCGTFGFKPSYGRVPQYGGFPRGNETLHHSGPITRSVADAALVMEIIGGRDDRDPFSLPDTSLSYVSTLNSGIKGMKVAWSPDLGFAILDPQVRKATEAAVKVFEALGCTVEQASPKPIIPEKFFTTIVTTGLSGWLQKELAASPEKLDPLFIKFIERCKAKTPEEYIQAVFERFQFQEEYRVFFEKYDLLLTPTTAVPAFEIGSYGPREIAGTRVSAFGWWPFTCQFDITGQPAASIPCGWTGDGLPVGLQIVGRRFDEATVFKAAAAFEKASPWANKLPPLE